LVVPQCVAAAERFEKFLEALRCGYLLNVKRVTNYRTTRVGPFGSISGRTNRTTKPHHRVGPFGSAVTLG